MTTRNAPDGKPAAANDTVTLDRFERVLGARRREAARRRQHRRNEALVTPNDEGKSVSRVKHLDSKP
jgi:hypothetical protein